MFCKYFLNTDVLCVTPYGKYILAGIGSDLFIYENDELKLRIKIFNGERVHNIHVHEDIILLKGCKEVSLANLINRCNDVDCHILCKVKSRDWIQDVFYDFKSKHIVLATAHNVIEKWNVTTGSCVQTYSCEEKCILYCCTFLANNAEEFVVLCGTVFSEVIVWAPYLSPEVDQPVLQRLSDHDGVIFSIGVDPFQKIVCTTSDDRSLRIWCVDTPGSLTERKSWEKASVTLTHTLYGHTARVWKSLILRNCIISAGEDSRLCVWSKDGKLDNFLNLHQESGIRGLCHSQSPEFVITGGEDGGIVRLTPHKLQCRALRKGCYHSGESEFGLPRKIALADGGVVCTTDRGCVLFADDESLLKMIYTSKEFSNYCLLEVSSCKKYIMLGSIQGHVVIIDAKSREVVFDRNIVGGKIFSMHWLHGYVIMCASGGEVQVFKLNLDPVLELTKAQVFSLPCSKERWTTCALINSGYLLLGDRMGSLHVYSMASSEESPQQSFLRLHGHLGLTHITYERDFILTSGRDGSVRQFHVAQGRFVYSLKYKLPMEWPWKVVQWKTDSLVLGFSSVNLIVWSLKKREMVLKYDCGGGHRSCDCIVSDDHLKFLYIRDKRVHFAVLPLASSFHVRRGFHAKEINCLRLIDSNPMIVVSGSEDTTLRISRITKDNIEELYVVESHISSVRDLNVASVRGGERILFSAGGRAQIAVHSFDVEGLRYRELETFFLNSPDRRVAAPSQDGETRIMCVDSVATGDGILVAAACSDRQIRMFAYGRSLTQVTAIPYTHCILKVRFIQVECRLMVMSMGTDGRVVFWDVTDVASSPDSFYQADSIRIHQSGINSYELRELGAGRFCLATGGDDNLLSVVLFDLNAETSEKCNVIGEWRNSSTHSCQITGIRFVGNTMLTASVDQRLTVWKCNSEGSVISVEFVDQYLSAVADVQGMEACQSGENCISVCLYGKGVEVIEVHLSSRPV